ncbi:uncharacterized protein N7484_002617 [Penicillium longicatenatum]|uniref:uncharacterized protein n=1 Tax=Penicillium longicatenatum TaxID=1561947 RepID=UPI0025499400|nr:uncharacterized protein N7484_002617 [Penicillium longicatenatum]KAJ5648894.1 hypothetical protein N7484_002617 [Penicillium longicatenatum]
MASTNEPTCVNVHETTQETPRSRSASPSIQSSGSTATQVRFSQSEEKSRENKLRPAGVTVMADIINRIIWDSSLSPENYVIVFLDRFQGELEVGFDSWKKESTDEEFIPQHRVLYIRHVDGEIIWDRRRRIDKIFNSGNSAFRELAFLA